VERGISAGPALDRCALLRGPVHEEFATWGPQITFGQGLDYDLPFFVHRFSLRILQADYLFDHVNYRPNETATLNSATLSSGLVLHLGKIKSSGARTHHLK
jgi:hypothetical protein